MGGKGGAEKGTRLEASVKFVMSLLFAQIISTLLVNNLYIRKKNREYPLVGAVQDLNYETKKHR